MKSQPSPLLVAALIAAAAGPACAASADDAMLKLANTSGCMTCHRIEPGAKGPDGLARCGGQVPGPEGRPEQIDPDRMAGSNPYQSHWKGQVSGLAMPPNAVAIKPADAKWLVKWILSLEAGKKS